MLSRVAQSSENCYVFPRRENSRGSLQEMNSRKYSAICSSQGRAGSPAGRQSGGVGYTKEDPQEQVTALAASVDIGMLMRVFVCNLVRACVLVWQKLIGAEISVRVHVSFFDGSVQL